MGIYCIFFAYIKKKLYLCARFDKMMRIRIAFICLCVSLVRLYGTEIVADSVTLPDVEVSVSRVSQPAAHRQMQVSVLDTRLIETAIVSTPKEAASLIPNIHMPEYGSAMTSSIYIRGLGSRINEPVLGIVVDGIPLLDKNLYDHTLQDVKRMELLRGAQGSLYGRNSPGGVLEIRTIQPLDLTAPLLRGMAEYGSANQAQAQLSVYRPEKRSFGWGLAARYRRTDGFYTNTFDGHKADHGQQAGGRLVLDGRPSDDWRITGTVVADWVDQGAFPYASVLSGLIDYNRPAGYKRLAILPSLRAEYNHAGYRLLISGSYQYLHDDMRMDQDYTRADIFTLRQTQHQHNASLDAILYAPKPRQWYEWTVGVSGFAKHNDMHAPVVFMREGIETLILSNANKGIQTVFPSDSIEIIDREMPILSDFTLVNSGAAVYHRSHFQFGHWHIDAGIRLDYEYTRMHYLSTAEMDYRFTLLMNEPKHLRSALRGTRDAHYLQVLPRLALSYDAQWASVYAYAAKGYKAGGYNPQIFSTVTQNRMMTDMASDMGMHLDISDPRFADASITSYRPETDWTFEVGTHLMPVEGLKIDLDAFHIQCYNQQVTIFPTGKATGRMMANAARSRVWGAEAAIQYRWTKNRWFGLINASYGFTDARFIRFDDGMAKYDGHFIPYAPRHTVHALLQAGYTVGHKALHAVSLAVKGDGTGRIRWNEQNDCCQPFYGLLGAMLTLDWRYAQLQLWGKNLTGTHYDVFYFRSMDHDFLQHGHPRELGATVRFSI